MIAGYVPSTTSRKAIGSLVLGYYDDGKLIHAGRVGTGYTATVAEDLYRRLERIRSPSSPFAERLSADAARQVARSSRSWWPRSSSVAGRRPESAPCLLPRPARGQGRESCEIVRETVGDSAKPPPRTRSN